MNTTSIKNGTINNATVKTLLLCATLLIPQALATETAPASTSERKQITVQANADAKTTKSVSKVLSKSVKSTKTGGMEHKGLIPKGIESQSQSGKKRSSNTLVDSANKTASNHDVWFYSVDITLFDDPNHNGYYNHMVIDFDADTLFDHIDVYAVLSLTDPNGIMTEYYVTDNFDLYGESTNDTHQVDTILTTNWMADGYDLSIELFDAYNHQPVAYVDKYDAPQMGYLTLESVDYEYSAEQYLTLFSVSTWLDTDSDGDGYYHQFNIDLDIDVNYGSKDVYAEFYISDDNYNWQSLYTSDHFIVNENDASDKKHWEFELLSGHAPGSYYVKVLIVDADNHYTMMELLPEHHDALYALPLEDFSYEIISTPAPVPNSNKTTSTVESSGGNMGGPVALLVMGLFALIRRQRTTQQ
ncbi:MAG: choice-of-anchor H family protein [Psychrosphaera sp.]|nr:choice-of-anchor H family protein [Psychrosphaera sp.]